VKIHEIAVIPIPEVVFFPLTILPLRIEEPIYQLLIKQAVERGAEVAVSMARRTNQNALYKGQRMPLFAPAPICGVGSPVIVEEKDGAIKVLIKGTKRVRLLGLVTNLPYPIFQAEEVADEKEIFGRSFGQIQQMASMLDNWVAQTVTDSQEREAFYSGLHSATHIINYCAMLMIGDRDIRQLLLECDGMIERVNLLFMLLHDRSPLDENPRVSNAIKRFEVIERLSAVGQ
jgi:Lon protease-like protein